MLELKISLPVFLRRDFAESWIKSPISESPSPCQSFSPRAGARIPPINSRIEPLNHGRTVDFRLPLLPKKEERDGVRRHSGFTGKAGERWRLGFKRRASVNLIQTYVYVLAFKANHSSSKYKNYQTNPFCELELFCNHNVLPSPRTKLIQQNEPIFIPAKNAHLLMGRNTTGGK